LKWPVGEKDHVEETSATPATLVMYGDYECPYCGRAHPLIEELRERMSGGLRFVFRHFPLDSVHPHARKAAEAAEAAGAQGFFWEMHHKLYDNQDRLEEEDLLRYAAELGLDGDRFAEDLSVGRHAARVAEDREGGEASGVGGTPAFFVNGVRYTGSLDLEGLQAALEGNAIVTSRPGRRLPDPIEEVCSERRGVNTGNLKRVVELAVEIAREGREGRKIGTLFVVGDCDAVLESSRPMILDPLTGHPDEAKKITDPDVRETVKELAQLDGAFVVSDEGVVVSAARYIDASSEDIDLPLGLGSRHVAGASVSGRTDAVAVVVSESSKVRLFDDGEMVAEIVPELWLLDGYGYRQNEAPAGRLG